MFFLPVTLLAVLSSSLLMALIFIPTIGGIFGFDKSLNQQNLKNLTLLESGDLNQIKGLQSKYIKIMRYSLDNPKKLITLTLVFLVFTQFLYMRYGKGVSTFLLLSLTMLKLLFTQEAIIRQSRKMKF